MLNTLTVFFVFFFSFRVRIDNWMRSACCKVGFSCRRLPLKPVFPSWLLFFFFLAVTLPAPCLSVCQVAILKRLKQSGSLLRIKGRWWSKRRRWRRSRRGVTQETRVEEGWGGFDLSTLWGLFLGKQPLRNKPKKTGWHTLLDWSEEFVASVLVSITCN